MSGLRHLLLLSSVETAEALQIVGTAARRARRRAGCDRNDTGGEALSNRRGGLVTQAGLDDSLAGKG